MIRFDIVKVLKAKSLDHEYRFFFIFFSLRSTIGFFRWFSEPWSALELCLEKTYCGGRVYESFFESMINYSEVKYKSQF